MPAPLEPGQRIAVTGANGFIGAHCVVALLEAGFHVVAIVRDPTNPVKTKFLQQEATKMDKAANLSFAAGDLYQAGSYDEAFANCDGVLHTAAVVEINNVKNAEAEIVRPSVEGTTNVLQSVHKNSIRRYVHFSSVAAVQSLEKPEDHVFTEEDWNTWSTVENGDPYGYAKTKAERLVWDDPELKDTDVVVLNPAIVLGPCLCKAHTKSSAVLIRQILYGNPMLNYNGSFVDVRDVARAAVLAFSSSNDVVGKRFLLCATEPSSTLALNEHVKAVHPWVKGSPPQFSPTMIAILSAVGQVPVLGQVWGFNEFHRAMFHRLLPFDATQSKTVLGVTYRSMADTCRDTVDSMKPFVKISNWGDSRL